MRSDQKDVTIVLRAYAEGDEGAFKRIIGLVYDENRVAAREEADRVLALDEALTNLREVDETMVRVVECRFFSGLTEQETADALSLSLRTVQRQWMRARAWLKEELQ